MYNVTLSSFDAGGKMQRDLFRDPLGLAQGKALLMLFVITVHRNQAIMQTVKICSQLY